MPRTYFFEHKRANGEAITVEYTARGGESHHDHPGHVCDGGGSGPEIEIVAAFLSDLSATGDAVSVELTDEEDESLCEHLAENFVDDDYDDYGWDNNYV